MQEPLDGGVPGPFASEAYQEMDLHCDFHLHSLDFMQEFGRHLTVSVPGVVIVPCSTTLLPHLFAS